MIITITISITAYTRKHHSLSTTSDTAPNSPEIGRRLHQQLDALEASSGGGVVEGESSPLSAVYAWHPGVEEQPAQDVQAAVSATRAREVLLKGWKGYT